MRNLLGNTRYNAGVCFFSMLLAGAAACKSRPPNVGQSTSEEVPVSDTPPQKKTSSAHQAPPDAVPAAAPTPLTVTPEHFVFIGKAVSASPLDCAAFDTSDAPHRRPPSSELHDATDYPERHSVAVEILDALQIPAPVPGLPAPGSGMKIERKAQVAFALGRDAFQSEEHRLSDSVYDKRYCERLNGWLSSDYLVVHAFVIHVDRGNSYTDEWTMSLGSLGTNPATGTAGFATMEEARSHAKELIARGRATTE